MVIDFDPAKDAVNVDKHGLSLTLAAELEIKAVLLDDRDYDETRYRAFGTIGDVPYCLVFTWRSGVVRAISLRRAHLKEYRRHVG
jgi:uncharacterized DUF497 family protein